MAQPAATTTSSLSAGTSTKVSLVQRVLREIDDVPYLDSHSSDPTTSATTLTVATGAASRYETGGIIDWTDNGTFEAATITAIADTTLTIRRADYGTTAGDHAANAVYRYNPRWLSHAISEFVDESVNNLWPDIPLIQVSDYTVAATPENWYAAPAATEQILDVYQKPSDTPASIEYVEFDPQIYWFDTAFAVTGKAFYCTPSSSLTTMFVLHAGRLAATQLTSMQADIVVYDAALRALRREGHRPTEQGQPAVFDVPTKIQILDRELKRLREREMLRLAQYRPRRSRIVYQPHRHYDTF